MPRLGAAAPMPLVWSCLENVIGWSSSATSTSIKNVSYRVLIEARKIVEGILRQNVRQHASASVR
jgi:hypothetical protein